MKKLILQHKGLVALTFMLSILASAGGVLIALILQRVIDAALQGNWPLFHSTLIYTAVYLVVLSLISYLYSLSSMKLIRNVVVTVRDRVFHGIFHNNAAAFAENNTADYVSALTNDVKQIEDHYIQPMLSVLQNLIVFVASLIALLYVSPLVTALTVGCVLLMFIVPSLFGKALQSRQQGLSVQMSAFTTRLKDLLSGYEVLASFGMKRKAIDEFSQENKTTGNVRYQADRLLALNESISGTLAVLTQLSVVFIAAYLILKGQLSGGSLVALVQLSGGLVGPILVILQSLPLMQGIKPVVERLEGMVHPAVEHSTEVRSDTPPVPMGKEIQVNNLSFSYGKHQSSPVLTGINLTIHRGKKYALVGRSGAGKSTLVKLLSGYYDQYEGSILLDGGKVQGDSLSRLSATIHQNIYLFDTDIKHNISLYDEYSDAQLSKASEISGMTRFMDQLPAGLQAPVGENGSMLSGGQRQRIALARALIRNKPILILDEGTSAIDLQTAHEIESRLLGQADLTLITITHRLNEKLLAQYDEIIYMEDGRIRERGSLQQLMETGGTFKQFYTRVQQEAS